MKQNWTYKKLGDYIKEYNVKNKSNESISVYSVTNSQGFCKEYFSKEVASKDKTTYKIVPYGCFAYNPSRINVGSIDWQHEEEQVIVSPLYNVFSISKDIMQEYLLYYLKSANTMAYINAIATGTVRANLKMSMLKDFVLPLPPLSTQQSIVAELDEINNLLSLKRKELDAYDKLAQSLFYEMFGDPSFETKTLDEIYKFIDYRGKTPNKINSGIPLVTAKNVRKGYLDYTIKDFISLDEYKGRQTRGIAKKGDLLFTTEAPLGYAALADLEEYSAGQRVIALQSKGDDIVNTYVMYYILSDAFQHELSRQATGSTAQGIKASKLKNMSIPLPPLSLQQTFATRIEAIEVQKANVKAAIEKLETLLAARMQYWFE